METPPGRTIRVQLLVGQHTWERAAQVANDREMSLMAWVREAIREKLERDGPDNL